MKPFVGESIESVLVNATVKSNSIDNRSTRVRGNSLYDLCSYELKEITDGVSVDSLTNSARIVITEMNNSDSVEHETSDIVENDLIVNRQWKMTGRYVPPANNNIQLIEIRARFTNENGHWGPWMNVTKFNDDSQNGSLTSGEDMKDDSLMRIRPKTLRTSRTMIGSSAPPITNGSATIYKAGRRGVANTRQAAVTSMALNRVNRFRREV